MKPILTFGVQPKFAEAVINHSDDHITESDKVKVDNLLKDLHRHICTRMGKSGFDSVAIHLSMAPVVNPTIGVCEVDRICDVECTEIEVYLIPKS